MRNTYILLAVAILFLTTPIFADSGEPINLALIADQTSVVDKSPLISLLEIELAQNEGIQLLERAAIDSILEEQKLSAAGLLDRNNTIKIGKLLRADAFIILSTEKSTPDSNMASPNLTSGDLIRVRVSETAHGLRLLDYFVQSDSNSVGSIVKKLESVLNKINQPDEKLIPIGIVDIHRVQLAEQYKMLERTLPVLLSVRLNLEPQIVMLERDDLKVLLDEKLMTEGEDTEFWSSAILIDGYIQPNNGQLEMHLNLKQAAGENLKSIIIPVEPNEPSEAIVQATTEIIQQLQNSPPAAKWQPEQEAEQFYKQSEILFILQRYEEALSLSETAHALQPQNIFYTGAIFKNEWNIYLQLQAENSQKKANATYSEIEMAELVSIYVRQIHDSYEKNIIDDAYLLSTLYGDILNQGSLGSRLMNYSRLGYFGNIVSVSNEKIKEINKNSRRIWSETLRKIKLSWSQQLYLVWYETDDFNQVIESIKNIYANHSNSVNAQNYAFSRVFWQTVTLSSPCPIYQEFKKTQFEDVQQQCCETWLQFLHKLEIEKDSYAKLFSYIAKYEYCQRGMFGNSTEYRQKILYTFIDEFNTPNEPFNAYEKFSIRKLMCSFLTMQEYIEMLEPLIRKQDATNLILWSPGYSSPSFSRSTPETIEQFYQLLEKSAEIIKNYGNKQLIATQSIPQVLNYILAKQSKLRMDYPKANFAKQSQNILNTKMILHAKDWPQNTAIASRIISERHFTSIVSENNLWVVFEGNESNTDKDRGLYLAGINLEKKDLIALWQTKIPYVRPLSTYKKISGISLNKDIIYVSFEGGGIIEFPGSSKTGREYIKNPIIHNQEKGLPSVFITSMITYENKLLIAYGNMRQECGIGLYDPKSKNWESFFSSTIKDPPPFQNGDICIITNLILKSKNEVIFKLSIPISSNTFTISDFEGLWKLDLETKNLKLILTTYMNYTDIEPINTGIFQEKYLFKSDYHLFEFNTKSEQSKYIFGDGLGGLLRTLYESSLKSNNTKIDSIKNDFFIPESSIIKGSFGLFSGGKIDLLTATIHNNKLWARYGENQIIIIEKGKNFEDAQIIDNNILNSEPVGKFVSTPYGLVGIGKGTVGLIETENMEK